MCLSLFNGLLVKLDLDFKDLLCNNCVLTLMFVSSAEGGAEVTLYAPTSADPAAQQPMCYLEEEEEIYISEQIQEIADGIFVSYS